MLQCSLFTCKQKNPEANVLHNNEPQHTVDLQGEYNLPEDLRNIRLHSEYFLLGLQKCLCWRLLVTSQVVCKFENKENLSRENHGGCRCLLSNWKCLFPGCQAEPLALICQVNDLKLSPSKDHIYSLKKYTFYIIFWKRFYLESTY